MLTASPGSKTGLRVNAQDVALVWQPLALTSGTLKLDSMRAASVLINDQQAKTANAGPPESLRLPVRVVLDAFAIDQLNITGASAFSAKGKRAKRNWVARSTLRLHRAVARRI